MGSSASAACGQGGWASGWTATSSSSDDEDGQGDWASEHDGSVFLAGLGRPASRCSAGCCWNDPVLPPLGSCPPALRGNGWAAHRDIISGLDPDAGSDESSEEGSEEEKAEEEGASDGLLWFPGASQDGAPPFGLREAGAVVGTIGCKECHGACATRWYLLGPEAKEIMEAAGELARRLKRGSVRVAGGVAVQRQRSKGASKKRAANSAMHVASGRTSTAGGRATTDSGGSDAASQRRMAAANAAARDLHGMHTATIKARRLALLQRAICRMRQFGDMEGRPLHVNAVVNALCVSTTYLYANGLSFGKRGRKVGSDEAVASALREMRSGKRWCCRLMCAKGVLLGNHVAALLLRWGACDSWAAEQRLLQKVRRPIVSPAAATTPAPAPTPHARVPPASRAAAVAGTTAWAGAARVL